MALCAVAVVLVLAPAAVMAKPLRIASWNVMRLGQDDAARNYVDMARVMSTFDLVALQEVMSEQALLRLVATLEQQHGGDWNAILSHAIGPGQYKEHYAFVWNEGKVSYVDAAVVYNDTARLFSREPFSARFADKSGNQFIAANVHVIFGDDVNRRRAEARALAGYWEWLDATWPDTPVKLLMGDFNLTPEDRSLSELAKHARPLITSGASTLSLRNGKFTNLYDHIWIDKDASTARVSEKRGVLKYTLHMSIDHKDARTTISDHAPVYAVIDFGASGARSGMASSMQGTPTGF